jgi:hypothetical protein
MSSEPDATEFVDDDFQPAAPVVPAASAWPAAPAPTLSEVDSAVAEKQQKLAELKRQQEELERERAALEETRRRQMEFQTGREELLHNLTRGIGLLEESEVAARRDADQMARSLAAFKDALAKLQAINEDGWTKENFSIELTRALTTIENARMEWNSARLKLAILDGETAAAPAPAFGKPATAASPFSGLGFLQLCKIGLALTWPLLLPILGLIIYLALHFRR